MRIGTFRHNSRIFIKFLKYFIWFTSGLLSLSSPTLAINANRYEVRWKKNKSNAGLLQRDFKEYRYPSCQQYDDQKEENYFISCEDGRVNYLPLQDKKIHPLNLPSELLRKQDLKKDILKTLRSELITKMEDKFKNLKLHYDCLNQQEAESEYCKNVVKGYKQATSTYLPQMRKSLALSQAKAAQKKMYLTIHYRLENYHLLKYRERSNIPTMITI